MAQTALNPPAAAARAPVAIVSTSSLPGSRRWTCRSTNPGATTWPRTSRTSARSVGDAGVDLDAAVHGARVHDGQRARCFLDPLERDAEHAVVLAHARDEAHLHALELQPQHVEHVGPLDRFFDAAEAAHTQVLD